MQTGALRAARSTAALRNRLRRRGVPVVYVNDNFGDWSSNFSSVVRRCAALRGPSGTIAKLLAPSPNNASVLKPRHSAFYGTPLEFLLAELGAKTLILTGITADACITVTAHDAHIREFDLWIPRDCVASASANDTRAALAQLKRVTKAVISSSSRIPF